MTTKPQSPASNPRALASVSEAMRRSNANEDVILEAIECGSICWAFNIASRKAKRRRLVRILSHSLDAYLEHRQNGDVEFDQVVGDLFPGRPRFITAKELARSFNCGSEHALQLIREKTLRLAKAAPWRRGPGGSPAVELESVISFLKARRI